MKRLFPLFAAVVMTVSSLPASAATLLYSITGTNGFSASFKLDTSASRSIYFPDDFYVFDVAGTYSDGSDVAGLTFYNSADKGGLTVFTASGTEASFTGLTLYKGPLATSKLIAFGPTLFLDFYNPSITYTSSASIASVPEPAAWAMLLVGFALVGTALRRRDTGRIVASAA